ncbi:pseudouridine synthase [Roseateles sp.]|uniref:pseudouridine synthase n=1 Tax=Roseateles sp. TaxID=1971397 RepID=UPI0031D02914
MTTPTSPAFPAALSGADPDGDASSAAAGGKHDARIDADARVAPASARPLPLLFLDDALAIIDKPAGLLVHRTALDAHEQDAALQRLRDQLDRPVWPAHRLDRGTSGVLVFALDSSVASVLGVALAERRTRKRYLALVRGWPAEDAGVIDHPLARDPELPSAGQPLLDAQTEWSCLNRLELPLSTDPRFPTTRVALLACEPVQGRRHQIRRHLKHIAHPIVGDSNHGKGPLNRALAAHFGHQRLWLHAQRMTLAHPLSGAELSVEAPLGPEWAPFLAGVAASAAGDPREAT